MRERYRFAACKARICRNAHDVAGFSAEDIDTIFNMPIK